MRRWLLLLPLLAGCEPGLEAAGVLDATATRLEDDRVSVEVTLACGLVYGMARSQGCDADGERVCVSATWYAADDTVFAHPLHRAESCQTVPDIIGTQVTVTTPDAVDRDPGLRILVSADPRVANVIIPNP
ncbi:hypothetical protein [Corallococcus sp. CA049B]|uniref:hypothetical protein n=1 Tax=Corallococcus sp. CA049B TaxID=2316730 RepID=UPI0011C3A679|nr:hypothetical protein [Corallococcus sp. CA049B]